MRLRRAAPILSVLASCGADAPDRAAPSQCAGAELIVAASDYSSSLLCRAPGCENAGATTGLDLGADPMLVGSNGRMFWIARDVDQLFEVDPSCGTPATRTSLRAFAPKDPRTGEVVPANPHGAAAAADGTVIVPLYSAATLLFVRDGAIEPLNLAEYDKVDGNPQADAVSIVRVGDSEKAFVTLERLDDRDGLVSKRASQMLRVDVATRKVEAVIELAGRNPFNPMAELEGALFLAEPGSFTSITEDLAGIERFDTATSTTRLLVRESALGGSVVEVAVTSGCGVAIVAGPEQDVNPTSVVAFDPETGRVLDRVVPSTPGFDLSGLAWRGDSLYVGDRRRGPTGYPVHVFERAGACTLTATGRTIHIPQRPVALRNAR